MKTSKCTHTNPSSNLDDFLGFDCKNNMNSQNIILNLVKSSFLFGADMVLMAQKSPRKPIRFDSDPSQECGMEATSKHKIVNQKVSRNSPKYPMLRSSSSSSVDFDDYVDVSKVVNSPSGGYNEFPLNMLGSLAMLVLKLFGLQMNVFVRVFTFPIWLTYFSFMFILFPFQTLSRVRHYVRKMLFEMWISVYLTLTSFICQRLKMGVRFGWAFLSVIYVCFILVGMLLSGFLIGGFTMKRLVERPIQATETLNFDYTKASPVALVPFSSSTSLATSSAGSAGIRAIPYNHKLQLTVSLTMPESDYNRKLGVFQVRVDFLSANGRTAVSTSRPCMLRFKSGPIRVVETVFKSVPLIAGFQSEVQIMKVEIDDFTEGKDPTAGLRVVLEQRAEYQSGAGVPEIYAASLDLQSELPRIKMLLWTWRSTLFVWISMTSFLMQLLVVLIFCRAILLPKGKLIVTRAKKQNKISWY